MNNREKAIVMAYTGIAMLTGQDLGIFCEYIKEIIGRPIWTHEFADHQMQALIKEKSKADFLKLCESPRVITLVELLNAKNLDVYLEETCETQTHPLLLVETENESTNQAAFFWPSIVRPLKSYGKTWRCWTSLPTDEQREAVKWNESDS